MAIEPRVPDDCAIRLIDLPPGVGGLLAVDEDGFVNIYLNARLTAERRERALEHELRHYYRNDMFSDEDIREVERLAELPERRVLRAIDGTPLEKPPIVFPRLRRVGRGLYRPAGDSLDRAGEQLSRVGGALMEACHIYDVMQTPPHVPVESLRALAAGLSVSDIAFFAWEPPGQRAVAALRFFHEAPGQRLHGAIFYGADARPDNALAAFELMGSRITVDLRLRRGRPEVRGIARENGGNYERMYQL